MSSVQQKDNLVNLILDEHGNYIVQKVLSLENSNGQISMLEIIKESFDKLKDLPYGGKIISRIMATYPIIKNLWYILHLYPNIIEYVKSFCYTISYKQTL